MIAGEVDVPGQPIDYARCYIAAGLRVIPIRHGTKYPPLTEWQNAATSHPETVENWWTGLYRDHGLGIATGPESGVWVLDVDVADGKTGDETLAALEDTHGPIPPTWEAITGTRGTHYFFRWDPTHPVRNQQSGKIGHGLDVRGDGGQVVAAPTVHATGAPYQWAPGHAPWETGLADAPAWLYGLLEREAEPRHAPPSAHPNGDGDDGDSIAATFNGATTWPQLLEADGWTLARTLGNGEQQWTRPGKNTREGHSATVGHEGRDVLKVFTSSVTELEADKAYSRFGYEAAMRWAGDRSAFARHLRTEANGPRTPPGDLAWIRTTHEPAQHPTAALNLPAEFWDARPALTHIRQAAHSRNRSADAVLHTVLARVSSQLQHNIDLPAIVGGRGSLNYYAALIGHSGAGKSTAIKIAQKLTRPRATLDISDGVPLGSGEGVAELYMGEIPDPDDDKGKRKTRGQVRHNVWLYADEGEALIDMRNRQGATIMETLRRGWTGDTLGQSNASAERKRIIPEGMYRFAFVIGFQPSKASGLLADHVGGTPQRFMWANATDPSIPDDRPDWPGPLPWSPPTAATLQRTLFHEPGGVRRAIVEVHPDICAEIVTRDRDRARGTEVPDPFDTHEPLHRLKTAALLAILDRRLAIDLEDWALSATIWHTSCAVRTSLLAFAQRDAADRKQSAIELHADKEEAAAARRAGVDDRISRLATRVAQWVHEDSNDDHGPWTLNQLKNRLSGTERHLIDQVVEHAIARGWLAEVVDDGTYPAFERGDSRPTHLVPRSRRIAEASAIALVNSPAKDIERT